MKKIIFIISVFFIGLLGVNANAIYNIDVDIDIDRQGTATIIEKWDVKGTDGTEWYKAMYDLENSELTDFTVSMDGKDLQQKSWNINESLSQKKGYYGINYTSDGKELCFGKCDYERHIFILKYKLSNYIFNTEDSQVLYWQVINELSNVDFDNFSVNITSYYEFPDTLDVWGYGYKGYAYVKDGKIQMSNESSMDGNYAVALVKFPLNTFETTNSNSYYKTFDDVKNKAKEGSYEYNYDTTSPKFFEKLFSVVKSIFIFFFAFGIPFLGYILAKSSGYGYQNNKKINKKEVPMFRDIPCNKDIYYANTLIELNGFGYKETNILGAIILKWVRENKISFKTVESGLFNKEKSAIDLTLKPVIEDENERALFKIMLEASEDGILETREFERWARGNYQKFLDVFKNIETSEITKLHQEGHLYERKSKEECKKKKVMDDIIYRDSIQLYGLKLFLKEFSAIDTREVIEVKLWDEYLMFAYLFGMADKVAKQLKNMYPEIIEQSNIDYNSIIFISNMSTRSVSAASSARAAAENYSSGGGGFSSGGGGGGSFGGGGGGSR